MTAAIDIGDTAQPRWALAPALHALQRRLARHKAGRRAAVLDLAPDRSRPHRRPRRYPPRRDATFETSAMAREMHRL